MISKVPLLNRITHYVVNRKGKQIRPILVLLFAKMFFLMDLKNPEKILARTPKTEPLMRPNKQYEKKGFINNVVFPTGIVPDLNGKDVLIYSGGADSIISVKKMSLKHILNSMSSIS